MGLFPDDDDDGSDAQPRPASALDEMMRAPTAASSSSLDLSRESLVGFWSIYDDLATEDSMNSLATGAKISSIFSAPLVLRADGQTSRGSDFPGGEWSLYDEATASGSTRWRLSIVLRSRLLRQELRYDGLVFALQLDEREVADSGSSGGGGGGGGGGGNAAPGSVPFDLRVVGKVVRWDVADAGAPAPMGAPTSFSMLRQKYDRGKLTATIQPFSAEVDPEAARAQSEWNRAKEASEEDELRRAIEDVRRTKEAHGDDWLEADKLVEGRDFWRAGEEPDDVTGLDDGTDESP